MQQRLQRVTVVCRRRSTVIVFRSAKWIAARSISLTFAMLDATQDRGALSLEEWHKQHGLFVE